MIKVLKRKELTRTKIKCSYCGSILEYDCTDVRAEKNRYSNAYDYYIKCPVCKRETSVQSPQA